MSREIEFKDSTTFHPGIYVEEMEGNWQLDHTELAKKFGMSEKTICKIINGEQCITPRIAKKMAHATGVSAQTWLNLQKKYDLKTAKMLSN